MLGYTKVAVVYGEGIKELFGEIIQISFASADVSVIYEEVAATNEVDAAFATAKKLPHGTQALIGIGGGKAIDYTKYTGTVMQLPIVAVPTVVSNDAFCSPTASMSIDGKRRTLKSNIPEAVIVDTFVLQKASERFLYSGIGDIFCKYTSVFDWKLAYKKTGEPVNDFASVICRNAAETFVYYPKKTFENLDYIGIIVSSLLMSGLSMVIAGSSRPASGGEHLISHAYDKFAAKPSLHGLQVGVASYGVSFIQEATFATVKEVIVQSGFVAFMEKNKLNKNDFIKAIRHAPSMKENYYTILSEKDSVERLIDFVGSDELMNKMLE
jgi:glycerol-1-phosphate dehydrogenase [NAD(P)+]